MTVGVSNSIIGQTISHYKILELLGGGGMGVVYKAEDIHLHRPVALKFLAPELVRDEDARQRFFIEARAASALDHPNVCTIYQVDEFEGHTFIAMAYYRGETLRDRVARGGMQMTEFFDVITQICDGLRAAHSAGIVHRDIKPANILITETGQVKVLDFGLAKLIGHTKMTTTGVTTGTVSYMSPEQAMGEVVDHRTDIWSLGVVMYEMLTSQLPFTGSHPQAIIYQILNKDPEPVRAFRAGVPPELEAIVAKCLAVEREGRYNDVSELVSDLRELRNSLSSQKTAVRRNWQLLDARKRRSPKSSPSLRSLVRGDRNRSLEIFLGLMLLLVLAGTAFLVGRKMGIVEPPKFQQLTFRRGYVSYARFAPDGETIVYGASWQSKPFQVFTTRPGSAESRPLGLPDGDVLGISSKGDLAVSIGRHFVAGRSTRGTLAQVPLAGGAPRELLADVEDADWSPDGSALAVTHVSNGRYRLEYPIGKVLADTEGWFSNVRVSSDGKVIAFIDHPLMGDDRGSVAIIDESGKKRTLTREYASVNGLAWHPTTREIWYTASTIGPNCALYATSTQGKERLITRSPGRLQLQDIHTSGKVLITEGRATISTGFRRVNDSTEQDLSWFDASVLTGLNADGSKILFNEQGMGSGETSYSVYTRSTDGSAAVRLGEGNLPSLSPDGKWVATIDLTTPQAGKIVLLPTGAGQKRTLPAGRISEIHVVAWMPSSQEIIFAANEKNGATRVYLQRIDEKAPRAVSPGGLRLSWFSDPVAPDGKTAAVVDGVRHVSLLDLASQRLTPLPAIRPSEFPIRWTADGKGLLLFDRNSKPTTIFRYDLSTHERVQVAQISPSAAAGIVTVVSVMATPDLQKIAYSYAETRSDLYLIDNIR